MSTRMFVLKDWRTNMSQVTVTDVQNVKTLSDEDIQWWIDSHKAEILHCIKVGRENRYIDAILDDYETLLEEKYRRIFEVEVFSEKEFEI